MPGPLLRIVVVDDDPSQLAILRRFVQDLDAVELTTFELAQAALEHVKQTRVDVLVVDLHMPAISGRELLSRSIGLVPELPVVIMTSSTEVETAVELMRLGARDYLTKPLSRPLFVRRVVRLAEQHHLQRELARLQDPVGIEELVGHSPALQQVKRRVQQLAEERAPVWVSGPPGVGLARVALALHHGSSRAESSLVSVDALPRSASEREALLFGRRLGAFAHESQRLPGLVERARGGTLVIPSSPELSEALYERLVRMAEDDNDGPRLVLTIEGSAPPWMPAEAECIVLPALADRPTDIGLLAHHVVERLNRRFMKSCFLTSASIATLQARPWPGNLEELGNVLESAVLASDGPITPSLLLPGGPEAAPHGQAPEAFRAEKERTLQAFEADYLHRLLLHEQGHLTRAARRAGMDRKNLWQLLRKHDIDAQSFKPGGPSTPGSQVENRPERDHG